MVTGPGPRPSWADELLDLAAQEATGRLVVLSSAGDEGWVEFRDGELVGVSAASRRPLLARRLTAFGVMAAPDVAPSNKSGKADAYGSANTSLRSVYRVP